jgi:tRNA (adenine57-N1/adenine58-N1)-methyltransferase
MLAPWECLDAAAGALVPGGVLCAYLATTTQLSRLAESLRVDGRWTEPVAWESLVRTWHLEGLAVRPDHRMIGHTGFLITSRRLADGTVLPVKRTRPSKGSYGDDYTGPGAPTAPAAPVTGSDEVPARRAARREPDVPTPPG